MANRCSGLPRPRRWALGGKGRDNVERSVSIVRYQLVESRIEDDGDPSWEHAGESYLRDEGIISVALSIRGCGSSDVQPRFWDLTGASHKRTRTVIAVHLFGLC